MTDTEKKAVIDAIVKIAHINSEAPDVSIETSNKIAEVTKDLENKLGITDECNEALIEHAAEIDPFGAVLLQLAKAFEDKLKDKDEDKE